MKGDICRYFEKCNVSKITGRDCADLNSCQTRKFYDRYGLDYLMMGCGAMMVPVGLEKEVDGKKDLDK